MLLEFLSPREQQTFPKTVANVLEIFHAFEPEVSKPYSGQPLVGTDGRSQLVTLAALRPARKNLIIPRGVGLPEDIVKVALLCEMSPLKEVPCQLHLLDAPASGKLRVTDPLKSFLRVADKRLGWKIHWHADESQLAATIRAADGPPYFFCVKDRHLFPLDVLMAVAEQGGYLYEGLPSDALTLFRWLTATQAWTVACTEAQVPEATATLQKMWQSVGLREEPHESPEIITPSRRSPDIGGGFGASGVGLDDDKDWAELDDDDDSSSSSSSDSDEPAAPVKGKDAEPSASTSKP